MYTDPNFHIRVTRTMVGYGPSGVVAFGTATSSATTTQTPGTLVNPLPPFIRKTKLWNVQVYTGVAAKSGTTALLVVMNGTATVGTCTPAAAGTWTKMTLPTSTTTYPSGATQTNTTLSTIAAGSSLTINVVSTATASSDVLGSYAVECEIEEMYE